MKKLLLMALVVLAVSFASCNGKTSGVAASDSVDSTTTDTTLVADSVQADSVVTDSVAH